MSKIKGKRLSLVSLLLLVPFLLAGCVKFTMDLEISRQDTISGVAVLALTKELSALAEEQGGGPSAADSFEGIAGVTRTEYDDGVYVGQQYEFAGVPIEELTLNEDESALKIVRDGDNLVVSGSLSLEDESAGAEAQDDFGFGQAIFDSADIRVSIKFPGEILETNGEIDEETNTVTWEPKYGEENELSAVVYSPQGLPIWVWWVAAGVGALALSLLLVFLVLRFARRNTVEQPGEVSAEIDIPPIDNVRFAYRVPGAIGIRRWLGIGPSDDLEVTLARDILRYLFRSVKTGGVTSYEEIRVTDISDSTYVSDSRSGSVVRLTVSGGIVDIPASPADGKTLIGLLAKPASPEKATASPVDSEVKASGDALETLERLHALREKGALSEEEYLAKKDEILKRL